MPRTFREKKAITNVMQIMSAQNYAADEKNGNLPLIEALVPAGFPAPTPDAKDMPLNVHDYVVKNPSATYFVRVTGYSMVGAGIYPDDILVVDKSIEVRHGHIVVAAIDGEMTVKRLFRKDNKIMLMPENNRFQPLLVHDGQELDIWGVVTFVVHRTVAVKSKAFSG